MGSKTEAPDENDHVEYLNGNPTPTGSNLPIWKQKELRKLYLMFIFLFLGSTTLGYDASLLNGLQTMNSWQSFFSQPTGSRLGIFGAMPGFGGLFALLFAPYIADGLGRKRGTAIGCLIVVIGSLLQSFPRSGSESKRDAMYLCGRFIMGIGSNISNGTCPLLITEIAHPRHRGKVTTVYNTLWYVGSILAAWVCFGTLKHQAGNTQWVLPTAFQCLMPGVQLLAIWLIPESPRWLISKDRSEVAREILVKYHGNNDPDDEFVRWEFTEIANTLRLENESSGNGWLDMAKTKGNRKRCALIITTAIFSPCSGNGLVSYYLAAILKTVGITDSITQSYINGGLTIWCWLVSLGASFLVDRAGRRVLFLFAGVGMLISFSIWTACSAVYAKTESTGSGTAVIAMIFLFYGVAGAAWPGLTVSYTIEILPYNIRAKGLTLCFCFTALSGVFNQWVNPLGLESLHWRFYFVYIVVLILECLIIFFFFPETKGPTLEEIAVIFDGGKSAAGIAQAKAFENAISHPVSNKRHDPVLVGG